MAIVQSSYIPWKGYFDLINLADEFILFDDVQYTRRDWRNRNTIKTPQGLQWLTIPVEVKGRFHQLIRETRVSDPGWGGRHWRSLVHNYGRAAFFHEYAGRLEELFLGATDPFLSAINHRFMAALCEILGIGTRISRSSDYEMIEGKTERLVHLCVQACATDYLSGPSARAYIDEALFARAGIRVRYIDYAGYPEYRQLHGPFEHHVSALDLILNEGPGAPTFMKSFTEREARAGS